MENLRELWDITTTKFNTLPAVRWLNKKEINEATYNNLNNMVVNIRKGLSASNISNEHVALIGESSLEWIASYLGIITGNNVAVPLDALLPLEDIIDLLKRSKAKVLFLSPRLIDCVLPILKACSGLKQIWLMQNTHEVSLSDTHIGSLTKLMYLGKTQPDIEGSSADSLATIIFTSGTTGKSKGVMLTQKNLLENVLNVDYEVEPGYVLMSVLPIHHAYCLVMDWLKGFSLGSILCINDSFMHMVRNMHIFKPRVMLMVPLMIESIYKRLAAAMEPIDKSDEAKLSAAKAAIYQDVFGGNLEVIFTGGAHLEPFYIEEFEKYGIKILEGYGMSECSPVIATNTLAEHKPGSIGKPLANVEIKISDEGEILVKGTSVMKGYYEMPEETSAAFSEGWLHTGDKGYLDEDGYLFINGRVKNLIIMSNGENISPEEIENKLGLNPLIKEVIITGNGTGLTAHVYPDEDIIEKNNFVSKDIQSKIQQAIDTFNSNQPSYRHITKLNIRQEPFIRNTTGKIKRNEIA
mgnify:FL=1